MTEIIDRRKAPQIHDIGELKIMQPQEYSLSNGMKVYAFDAATQEMVKVEVVLKAGAKYHQNSKLPIVVNKLLTEGTEKMTGDQIAAALDFYGASLNASITKDYAMVSLTVLNKYLKETLPILADVISSAVFPEKELDLYLSKKTQELSINNQRVGFVARDRFPALLYGEDNAYGRPSYIDDYKDVTREQLRIFFERYYRDNKMDFYVSGKIPGFLKDLLEENFGTFANKEARTVVLEDFRPSERKKHKIAFDDVVQNAIRIGKRWVKRGHPDYVGLQTLVTIYGGYFGSRLMMNIREDKGFTYGIGAGVSQNTDDTFMFISTEVKAEVTADALREIFFEMQRLSDEPVSEEELSLVKTVMQGAFQRGFDGPFATADRIKEAALSGLNAYFYYDFIEKLKSLTSDEIRSLAKKYFVKDDFYELVVGKY